MQAVDQLVREILRVGEPDVRERLLGGVCEIGRDMKDLEAENRALRARLDDGTYFPRGPVDYDPPA